MADVRQVLRKVSKLFNSSNHNVGEKITPDETELASFKRREHLDKVRIELNKYRKQNSILHDVDWNKRFGEKKTSILKQKNAFNPKRNHSIMKEEYSILNAKRCF